MNDSEQQIADELDALISAHQAGQVANGTNDAAFAAQLVALAQRVVPAQAQALDFNSPSNPRKPNQAKAAPSNGRWQAAESALRSVEVKPNRARFALGSAVALAMLVLASALVFAVLEIKPRPQTGQSPTAPANVPTEAPPFGATPVPTAPATPAGQATPLPAMPEMPAGFTASLEGYRLAGRELVLSATLPSNTDAPVVRFAPLKRIRSDELRSMAVRLGMQPNVYRSGWNMTYAVLTTTTDGRTIVPAALLQPGETTWFEQIAVIDGARMLVSYTGVEAYYSVGDFRFCCSHNDMLPASSETLQRIFSDTLLMSGTYGIDGIAWGRGPEMEGGTARRMVEGHPVGGTEVWASVNEAQQLTYASISLLDVEATGRANIRSAQETFAAVQLGRFEGVLKFSVTPSETAPLAKFEPTWEPHYPATSTREIFAHPSLWWPQDAGLEPVMMAGGFHLRSERMADLWADAVRGKLNAWGMATTDADGRKVLQVQGWEVVADPIYRMNESATGQIKRKGTHAVPLLVQADGQIFALPQAPDNATDGMWVGLNQTARLDRLVEGYPVLLFETIYPLREADANKPRTAQAPFVEITGHYEVMRMEGHDVRVIKTEGGNIFVPALSFGVTGLSEGFEPLSKTLHFGGVLRPESWLGHPLVDVRMTSDGGSLFLQDPRPDLLSIEPLVVPRAGRLMVQQAALVYFTPQRPGSNWNQMDVIEDAKHLSLIPMWRFSGHTEFGEAFAILADARVRD